MPLEVVQVTFRFRGSFDIRYLEEPPSIGDEVDGPDGRTWLVSAVEPEYQGAFRVTCFAPQAQKSKPDRAALAEVSTISRHGNWGRMTPAIDWVLTALALCLIATVSVLFLAGEFVPH
jgi:hypothetical protein